MYVLMAAEEGSSTQWGAPSEEYIWPGETTTYSRVPHDLLVVSCVKEQLGGVLYICRRQSQSKQVTIRTGFLNFIRAVLGGIGTQLSTNCKENSHLM